VEQRQKRVIITVDDNGTGIPEELYDRIFEPNFTSKTSGTGLGLTMVRKMVEDYKGEISVKSELGKGSTFTISLPTNM
jgi:signal transduction histidine kinase